MSINKGFFRFFVVPVALAMAIVLPIQPVLAAVVVGQIASANTMVDGVDVPSGTTLISPAVVETGSAGAVIHLSSGDAVALAPESTALVTSVDEGIRLAVQRGSVAYTNNTGAMETLSTTETMLVNQEGEIQQGARIVDEEEERLCELDDWTAELWQKCRYEDPKDNDCDWDLLKVPMSEVPRHLEKTAVLACDDRNDLDLDCDCKKRKALFIWWVPAAAAAGGVVLYEIIEKEEKEPASPSQP